MQIHRAIILSVVLATMPAGAQQPDAPAGPVESAPVTEQPEPVRALQALDMRRLETDRAYAETIIGHIDALAPMVGEARARRELDNLKMYALVTAGRARDARTLLDRALAGRPDQASDYALPWFGALRMNDHVRAVAVVETASQALRSNEWAGLRETLDQRLVWMVMRRFTGPTKSADQARFAASLFRIGWPGRDEPESRDALRMIMLDERLAQSDVAGAADLAAGIATPSDTLSLIVLRRYDGVVGEQDRLALLERAIAAHDRQTLAAVESAPEDLRRVLDRATFLRSIGREADAFALLEPFTRDIPATVARADEGMWIVNQAAYALIALGRADEAIALTEALVALPMADNPELIGPSINHSIILWSAGRHEQALAHATRLDRDFAEHANAFGRMWMLSSAVCALEGLGRRGAAAPLLRRLRAGRDDNPAALTRAYLCLGDMDAAEALLIRRLQGDDPDALVTALQDYRLGGDRPEATDPVYRRFIELRDRPAVRAALERVGRVLPLPLARTYWGSG